MTYSVPECKMVLTYEEDGRPVKLEGIVVNVLIDRKTDYTDINVASHWTPVRYTEPTKYHFNAQFKPNVEGHAFKVTKGVNKMQVRKSVVLPGYELTVERINEARKAVGAAKTDVLSIRDLTASGGTKKIELTWERPTPGLPF